MSNIVKHQTAMWNELKHWCEREQAHAAKARDCWPEIARRMARLRKDYPSDQAFGAALMEHGIEYGGHDRAAFIWMGRLKPESLEDALARCGRRSPRYFREEVESWGDSYFDPVGDAICLANNQTEFTATTEPAETHETPSTPGSSGVGAESAEAFSSAPVLEASAPAVEADPQEQGQAPKDKKKADDVLREHYTGKLTYGAVVRKLTKVNRERLAELVTSGRITSPNTMVGGGQAPFTARHIVQEIPWQWVRGTQHSTRTFRGKEADAIIANAERYIRMRDDLGERIESRDACSEWWAQNVASPKKAAASAPDLSAFAAPIQAPPSLRPSAEGEIRVHGVVVWPAPQFATYTFEQAWAAFHFWQDEDRYFMRSEPSAAARARHFMSMRGWLEYVNPGFAAAWHKIAQAQFEHPENGDDTTAPTKRFSVVS